MKPKICFTTNDRICNSILSATTKELFDLLYKLPGATPELVIGTLCCLVLAAANRASLTFAIEYYNTAITAFSKSLNLNVQAVTRTLPQPYQISAFLGNLRVEDAVAAINASLERQIVLAVSYAWFIDPTIMITDAHEIPAWNKKHRELIVPITPKKKSNNEGFRYFVSVLGNGKFWLAHDFQMDGPKDSKYHAPKRHVVVSAFSKAIQRGFPVEYMLSDSRFFETDVLSELVRHKIPYLMIARKTERVKVAVLEGHRELHHHYEPMVMPMVLGDVKRGKAVSYNLIIMPRPPEKRIISSKNKEGDIIQNYVTLATNMVPGGQLGQVPRVVSLGRKGLKKILKEWTKQLGEFEYRKRANIEVSCKLQEAARGRTNTRNNAIRVLLFGLMVLLYNLYMLLRMFEYYGVESRSGRRYLPWDKDVRMWRVLIFVKRAFISLLARYVFLINGRELIKQHKYLRNKLKHMVWLLPVVL